MYSCSARGVSFPIKFKLINLKRRLVGNTTGLYVMSELLPTKARYYSGFHFFILNETEMHYQKKMSFPAMQFILNLTVLLNVFWKKRVLLTNTDMRMTNISKIVNLSAIKRKKEKSGETEIGLFIKTWKR